MNRQKEKLVVIGNGMAGSRILSEIVRKAPDKFEMTVIGSEPVSSYNRVLLSSVLQGEKELKDIKIHADEWYEKNNINLRVGETVVHFNPDSNVLITDKGYRTEYDHLVFATGSSPLKLPIPGSQLSNVRTFRTMEDCDHLTALAKHAKTAIVIGGGLLGLEAAKGLIHLGLEVNVVHLGERIMERQLDETASNLLMETLKNQGIQFWLQKETKEIVGESTVEGVRFTDGTMLKADIVIMCAGIRPNIELAKANGIKTNRAIVVNDSLQTSSPNVYAIGECAEHRGIVYGLVQPLNEQAHVLAQILCGVQGHVYRGTTVSSKLKISGVHVFSAGIIEPKETMYSLTLINEIKKNYKRFIFEDDRLVGVILYGEVQNSPLLLEYIVDKQILSDERKQQLLTMVDSVEDVVKNLKKTDLVCQCNAVSKGIIQEAITRHGAKTIEEVKVRTKASSSCGGCSSTIKAMLQTIEMGSTTLESEKETLCACIDLSEDEVVERIIKLDLETVEEVRSTLGWMKSKGCKVCQKVLTYYVTMIHTSLLDYSNEELNVFEQNNGKFALTPEFYGGVISAEQVSRVAKIMKRYRVPYLRVRSDQRIELNSIEKEQLENLYTDLDLPLRKNNFYQVQPVLMMNDFRENKEQLLELATEMDKKLLGVIVPHTVQIGIFYLGERVNVTKCDLRIDYYPLGLELSVIGQGEEENLLFYKTLKEEMLLEMVIALIHYYRMTAKYLEPLYSWFQRMGIISVREFIFDETNRSELLTSL
ncbi:nitrite reductase large subunit NirB [Alkalihalobacillus sp. 1P02AB]|uniref:nitrite reductase large subunit NirB n=1 Tax=Alkalihalobacillus sp. 1P02AB TaxID=3132260 RepID=UPI0039A492B2